MDSYYSEKDNDVILYIKATPNASKNEICGLYNGALKVKIKAPAVENKANEELVKYFAKLLKLPKTSQKKTFRHSSKNASMFGLKRLGVLKIRRGVLKICRSLSRILAFSA